MHQRFFGPIARQILVRHEEAGQHGAVGLGVAAQEAFDLQLAFFREDRADAVEQASILLHQGPERFEQLLLRARHPGDIVLDMLPGDVGVTPRDTARRAGGVEQNRVKLPAVPPGVDIRGVGVPDRRFKSEALQVLVDRFSAGRADFHCREFDISEFQHVGRLAARRRAGVEHNLPVLRVERLNRQLAAGILRDPAFVKVDPVSSTVDRIQQSLYYVEKGNKKLLLPWLIKNLQPPVVNALVFSRTKHGADKIAKDLTKQGIPAAAIHGNKSQTARVTALEDFKSGKTRVLVATDIAARGIDISELSHVFNYDLPEVPETYVHRIGRTARAGADGTAVSFCAPEEQEYLAGIEKLNRRKIPVVSGHPWDGVPAPVRPVLPVRGKKPRPEAENLAEAPKKQAETAPAKAAKTAAPAPKQEPKAAKNAVPAKPKKEETLMQDSNTKRGARNDRRANNRGANAPKEAAAPRARRENAAPARGSNVQPKFDPHFVSAPEATPLRPARKTPVAPAAPAIRSAQEPQNNQNANRSGSRRNDRSDRGEQRNARPAAQNNNARPARNERGNAGNQSRTGSAPRAPKAEPARRGRNAAARDEDPGLVLISRRPPQQKYTSFEEYMDAHGGATAPIEDHSEEV